jgi:hypothetical protein
MKREAGNGGPTSIALANASGESESLKCRALRVTLHQYETICLWNRAIPSLLQFFVKPLT